MSTRIQLAIHPFFELWMQTALFRTMAAAYCTEDPVQSNIMRESADFFETLATQVHTAAIEINEQARLFARPL